MLEAIHELANWVVAWAYTPYGAMALGILAFAESSFFPIPPDVLLIALCLIDPGNSIFYAILCSLASVMGGIFGYGLGKWGGRPLLLRMVSESKIRFVEHYYQKYDVWAVAIAGFTPIPYKVFTVTAGVFLLDLKRFILASALGRSGRFFLVGTLFYFFGKPISEVIQKYLNIISILFVVALMGGFWFIHFWSKKNMATVPEPRVVAVTDRRDN
ncbi:YqaA family protein [Desulforhabdus amnigena]|jgi:membrane protein YqaA with SNARE-associated domain|uniref:VTT domain-containing protein n=1 Tax=Desulforhabdus amnigena TaxID=40218 RepID=A0A9W6D2Q8_9BACT|nr:YqaA family protein [Desulforhabdus amnigena]NLJ28867.1 DedA family protein [Deltaproteobacteria bacterium]GLI33115.1 hypothetical protein DAMNIGENAA_05480 [Desulforhabdus amnigena]